MPSCEKYVFHLIFHFLYIYQQLSSMSGYAAENRDELEKQKKRVSVALLSSPFVLWSVYPALMTCIVSIVDEGKHHCYVYLHLDQCLADAMGCCHVLRYLCGYSPTTCTGSLSTSVWKPRIWWSWRAVEMLFTTRVLCTLLKFCN